MRRGKGLILIALAVVAALPGAPAGALEPPVGTVTWFSLGDSYSSGEGISTAGGPGDSCARSNEAYGPLAARFLEQQRSWKVQVSHVACTGAVSTALFGEGSNPDGLLRSQVDQAREASGEERADVITMSIGGNDVGFTDVLVGCSQLTPAVEWTWGDILDPSGPGIEVRLEGCPVTRSDLEGRVRELIDNDGPISDVDGGEGRQSLRSVLHRLRDDVLTDDGEMVLLGYPRLFAPVTEWPAWRGRRCLTFSKHDAALLNDVTTTFDAALRDLASEVGASYVSRADLYDYPPVGTATDPRGGQGSGRGPSRSLCGQPVVRWMNGATIGARDDSLRLMRSFHPNGEGYAATARAVAAEVEDTYGVRAAPHPPTTEAPAPTEVPATAPPVTAEKTFEPGTTFSARCTVAWPTAPSRTSSATVLRTTCTGVPGQFLFVDVTCDDPDLDVTPGRPTVRVEGFISDVAESEYGFTVLIVGPAHCTPA